MLALPTERLGLLLCPILLRLLVVLYHGGLLQLMLLRQLRVVSGLAAWTYPTTVVGQVPLVLGRLLE